MKILIPLLFLALTYCTEAAQRVTVVTEDLWPLNYLEDGILKGQSTAIVLKALNNSGIEYEVEVLPWPRAYKIALEQPNTLIFSIVRTEKRESKFKWIAKLSNLGASHIMSLETLGLNSTTPLANLLDYRIATLAKSVSHHYLIHQGFNNIKTVNSHEQSLLMLINGRVDLVVGRKSAMLKSLTELGHQSVKLTTLNKSRILESYLAASLNTDQAIIDKITLALENH